MAGLDPNKAKGKMNEELIKMVEIEYATEYSKRVLGLGPS